MRIMAAMAAAGAACLGALLGLSPRPASLPMPKLAGWAALLGGCHCLALARRTWRGPRP